MQRIVELLQPVIASKDELSQEPVLLRGIDAIAGRFFEILSTSKDITLMVRKALKVKGVFSEYLEAFPLSGKRIRLLLPSKPPINERDARLLSRLKIETRYYDHPVLDMMVADELDVVLGVPERSNDEPFSARRAVGEEPFLREVHEGRHRRDMGRELEAGEKAPQWVTCQGR